MMDFVNLTPYKADIVNPEGAQIASVQPSGTVGLAAGDPPHIVNVPPPTDGVVYVVLPAVAEASDREDLLGVNPAEANRSHRGNVRSHVCQWPSDEVAEAVDEAHAAGD